MRQQTKPFIIERKPSRKSKTEAVKPSIWGKMDLTLPPEPQHDENRAAETPAGGTKDRG